MSCFNRFDLRNFFINWFKKIGMTFQWSSFVGKELLFFFFFFFWLPFSNEPRFAASSFNLLFDCVCYCVLVSSSGSLFLIILVLLEQITFFAKHFGAGTISLQVGSYARLLPIARAPKLLPRPLSVMS